ncbi:UAA transporter family-domain-containing protein [Baffinella frigidus]|nr:UAA transporter family-domain-containing protein [Cryptophyta sp. CCMP2293]
MLGATVILRKTYSFFEYLIAVGLVTGMGCFAAADLFERKEGDNSADSQWKTISGLVLLVGSLFCDSVLGNLQELVQKGNVCHEAELMYVQSLFSGLVLLLWTGISGELTQGILLCIKSREVVVCIIVWSLCNMLGVVLLLKVAGEFSAVTAVLTSFIRKFSSLLVSYAIFPKQLTMSHVAGLALVFSSVGAHAWHKLKRNKGSEDLRDHDKDYDHRRLSEMERLEPGEDESARKTSPRATPTSNGSVGQSHFFGGVTHPSGGVTHLSHENPASAGSGTATQLVEARL